MTEPMLIKSESDKDNIRHIPNLGKEKIKGWRLTQIYFVDSSGVGRVDEIALTFPQFLTKIKVGRAYGIIEAGQFQVNIGEYVRKK